MADETSSGFFRTYYSRRLSIRIHVIFPKVLVFSRAVWRRNHSSGRVEPTFKRVATGIPFGMIDHLMGKLGPDLEKKFLR